MKQKLRFRASLILFLSIASLLLSGCASNINKTMQSWVGHHQSELIASWGRLRKFQLMDQGVPS